MASLRFLASSASDVSPYEVGELLNELPGVSCACPWEPLLDDLDGFDSQGEVGGDREHLFINGWMARIWGKGALRALARSHAFILSVGEGEEVGNRRTRIRFLVPRPAALLSTLRG